MNANAQEKNGKHNFINMSENWIRQLSTGSGNQVVNIVVSHYAAARNFFLSVLDSVPDPHPMFFGPPRSASGSVIYERQDTYAALRKLFLTVFRIRILFFGPPGSTSRSDSGSSHQPSKKWRKTLISTVLGHLYGFLFLKNDVNFLSKGKKA